jgi:hypothetical protein
MQRRNVPAIWDTDNPALVAIQGSTLTDAQARGDIGGIPAHEQVVLVPRSLLEDYARQMR